VAFLDARPVTLRGRSSPRSPLERAARSRPKTQIASLGEPSGDDSRTAPAAPGPERRRNLFSRIFLGVFRGASTANPKP
jgi:hypothetical protein